MRRILLDRKPTYQDHVDIGLYIIIDKANGDNEFVTWLINKTQDHEYTIGGHYFSNLKQAYKDFLERR